MLNQTDWIIIVIAVTALMFALLLLRPQINQRDAGRIKNLRIDAEKDQQRSRELHGALQQTVREADLLLEQFRNRMRQAQQDDQRRIQQQEQSEHLLERARESERELRNTSTTLGQRLQQIQHHWDEQLDDTVDSIRQIRTRMKSGLGHVEDGLSRLQEQEKMAQGFTRKLIEHYQEQATNQQHNSNLALELRQGLEQMLQESQASLQQIRQHKQTSDHVFKDFAEEMGNMELQASEHFSSLYQTTDIARQELTSSLEEARHHLENLRRREEQTSQISQRIRTQANRVEGLNIEHLAKTIESTHKLCDELQTNVSQAKQALNIFDSTLIQVNESLKYAEAMNQQEQPVAAKPILTPTPSNTPTANPNLAINSNAPILTPVSGMEDNDKPTRQLFALRSNR